MYNLYDKIQEALYETGNNSINLRVDAVMKVLGEPRLVHTATNEGSCWTPEKEEVDEVQGYVVAIQPIKKEEPKCNHIDNYFMCPRCSSSWFTTGKDNTLKCRQCKFEIGRLHYEAVHQPRFCSLCAKDLTLVKGGRGNV